MVCRMTMAEESMGRVVSVLVPGRVGGSGDG
jgi:hypothetical protein